MNSYSPGSERQQEPVHNGSAAPSGSFGNHALLHRTTQPLIHTRRLRYRSRHCQIAHIGFICCYIDIFHLHKSVLLLSNKQTCLFLLNILISTILFLYFLCLFLLGVVISCYLYYSSHIIIAFLPSMINPLNYGFYVGYSVYLV